MSAEWAARPSQLFQRTPTDQTTPFAIINISLLHFTENIQVQINPFCAKTLTLTIMWCHMMTMALRGLNTQYSDAHNSSSHINEMCVLPSAVCESNIHARDLAR